MKIRGTIIFLMILLIMLIVFSPEQKKEDSLVEFKIQGKMYTSFQENKEVKILTEEDQEVLKAFLVECLEEEIILKAYAEDLKNFNFSNFYKIYPNIELNLYELSY